MRTFAIVNQKGGCGKTTTAINLAAVFARRGLRCVVIDMDPQAHCATGLGVPEKCIEHAVEEALLRADRPELDPTRYVWEVARNLHLIPSTARLAGLEAPGGGLHQLPDRDRRLALLVARLVGRYDRCLVDCPPTIGLLTFNALRAAREAIIPVETGFFALRGADRQWRTIRQLVERTARPIACHLVPTLVDEGSSLSREILATLRHEFAGTLVPVVIHEDDLVREATSFGQPITEYAPESRACRDYEALADWLEDHAPSPVAEIEVVLRDVPRQAQPPPPPPDPRDRPAPPGGRAAEVARLFRDLQSRGREGPGGTEAQWGGAELGPEGGVATVREPIPEEVGPAPASPGISPQERARLYYGAHPTPRGVRFMQPGGPEVSICVAGDFNFWSAKSTPLRYDPKVGSHMAVVEIPPGVYQYRLVVNGTWRADPYNAQRRLNEYQEQSSLLIVPRRPQQT
jgi:chromosome partitioning protein